MIVIFLNLVRVTKEYTTLMICLNVRKIVIFSKYKYRKKINRLFSPTQLLIQRQWWSYVLIHCLQYLQCLLRNIYVKRKTNEYLLFQQKYNKWILWVDTWLYMYLHKVTLDTIVKFCVILINIVSIYMKRIC